jgi:hypothetical protein
MARNGKTADRLVDRVRPSTSSGMPPSIDIPQKIVFA